MNTELQATRLKLRRLEMVQGTKLDWKELIRFKDTRQPIHADLDRYDLNSLEFAVGVVENRPVWKGDTLYTPNGEVFIADGFQLESPYMIVSVNRRWLRSTRLSWTNPKAPKMTMITISIEDAVEFHKRIAAIEKCGARPDDVSFRIAKACFDEVISKL